MNQPLRSIAAAAGLAVLLTACAGAEGGDDPAVGDPVVTGASSSTQEPEGTSSVPEASSSSSEAESTVDPDAPIAPDFTLELGGGGEFVLSEEAKPVYMVFWAEW